MEPRNPNRGRNLRLSDSLGQMFYPQFIRRRMCQCLSFTYTHRQPTAYRTLCATRASSNCSRKNPPRACPHLRMSSTSWQKSTRTHSTRSRLSDTASVAVSAFDIANGYKDNRVPMTLQGDLAKGSFFLHILFSSNIKARTHEQHCLAANIPSALSTLSNFPITMKSKFTSPS